MIQAVIFDWAGTTIDHGSLAPVMALQELFTRHGIKLGDDEVRRDMGIAKRDHIAALAVAHGLTPQLDALYEEFQPLQMETLAARAFVIEGVAGLSERLRGSGLRLGGTTGYTRPMLEVLEVHARSQGYAPDLSFCPDDVGGGRPAPWMCLRLSLEFRLSAMYTAVKIGDTPSDIAEGRNAGMWTVAVAATGNEVGITAMELARLLASERTHRIAVARARLAAAGAHYVVDYAAECEPVLEEINARLRAGERP